MIVINFYLNNPISSYYLTNYRSASYVHFWKIVIAHVGHFLYYFWNAALHKALSEVLPFNYN